MTLNGPYEDPSSFDLVPDLVEHVSAPYVYRRPAAVTVEEFCDQLVAELEEKILELGPENVAAFFAEPILGAGGVIVPPPGYHRRTQEVCRKYEVLYVSDEVVTGFGRLGHMLASEPVFELTPDIITCAKGITSGYAPLGATLISDAIYEVIRKPKNKKNRSFGHGFTYSGHALCCAASLKNIEILERERICEHVREVGPTSRSSWRLCSTCRSSAKCAAATSCSASRTWPTRRARSSCPRASESASASQTTARSVASWCVRSST